MKRILFILVYHCFLFHSYSQSIKKYPIGESGCSAYFYCDPGVFNLSYSEDSSKVYTAECTAAETSYGVICIQLSQPDPDISGMEDLLVKYLDYLKSSLKITTAAGYGKGHRLRGKEHIHGIIDYWTDGNKNNWKIKAWSDGKYIAVLYAYSKNELADSKTNAFLDGIVIKGM